MSLYFDVGNLILKRNETLKLKSVKGNLNDTRFFTV